jgi:hypothetical protein
MGRTLYKRLKEIMGFLFKICTQQKEKRKRKNLKIIL